MLDDTGLKKDKLTKGKGTRRKVSISQQCLQIFVFSILGAFSHLAILFLPELSSPWMRSILLTDNHAGGDKESKGGTEEENHSRNLSD